MARDIIHEAVLVALVKDGWSVTDDPLIVAIEDNSPLEIDLGAEKIFAAEKGKEKIAVEVKSFVRRSFINEFHTAIGQYLNYRGALKDNNTAREMILAISEEVYYKMDKVGFVRRRISEFDIKLLVVDIANKEITQWIK